MRYRRIEVTACLLTLALVAFAVAVAAVRSGRPPGPHTAAGPAATPATPAAPEPGRGAALYRAECASCHPPARTLPGGERYTSPGGREALIDLLLAGTIEGEEGAHPDAAYLDDADLAVLAGHLLAGWAGDETPAVVPAEVAQRRERGSG